MQVLAINGIRTGIPAGAVKARSTVPEKAPANMNTGKD